MLWNLIRPLLFTLSPESAHHFAFSGLQCIQTLLGLEKKQKSCCSVEDDRLKTKAFGLEFSNPVGLAAGFDKDARLLPIWRMLGFGFAEVGTITPLPQPGNPQPRLFRYPADKAVINRMGFNNEGAEVIHERLVKLLNSGGWPQFPVGVNLGKGKPTPLERAKEDYVSVLDTFLDMGDYFVVNVSSPNTPGLRELQEKPRLDEIFAALRARALTRCRPQVRPLLVKIAPDLEWSQLDDVLELCEKHQFSGIIATNTTLSRNGLSSSTNETGGLSGAPLKNRSTEYIRHIHKQMGAKLPIIGVGGIFSAEDAYEKIRAGASLVQVYTGFIYEGPMMVKKINEGLVKLLKRDGVKNISDVVGKNG